MTKEQYQKAVNDRRSQIGDLESQIRDIEATFVGEHALPIGTKVRFKHWRGDMHVGCIARAYMRYGELIYDLVKCKKDGTPSKAPLASWLRPEQVSIAL